jgi:hypothetical protein
MLQFKPRWKRTIFFLVTTTPKPPRTRSRPRRRHLAPNPQKGKQEVTTMNLVFWNPERLILNVAVRPDCLLSRCKLCHLPCTTYLALDESSACPSAASSPQVWFTTTLSTGNAFRLRLYSRIGLRIEVLRDHAYYLESAQPFFPQLSVSRDPSRPFPPGMGSGMLPFRHIHSCSSFEPRTFPSTLSVYY